MVEVEEGRVPLRMLSNDEPLEDQRGKVVGGLPAVYGMHPV